MSVSAALFEEERETLREMFSGAVTGTKNNQKMGDRPRISR